MLLFILFLSGVASAAYIHVTPTSGIKNAISDAQNGDTLNLTSGTYNEYNININKNLTINGPKTTGTPTAIIDAQNNGRVFNITSGIKVNLKYLIIQNGNATKNSDTQNGGGIQNSGNLTVTNSIIQKNTAYTKDIESLYGGGIYNLGTLTITGSTVKWNTASFGAGISSTGTCTVTNSNINDNKAYDCPGGIYNSGILTVNHSNVYNNNATGYGGGILNGGSCIITDSNIHNNIGNDGGGIYNVGNLTVTDSNITNNTATNNGGGIYNNYHTLNMTASNITNNTATRGGGIYKLDGHAYANFNRIIGNTAEIGNAIYCNSGSVNAHYNWWGSNASPSSKVYGTVYVDSWLVLKVTANPITILNGGKSTITANLLYDSHGVYHDPVNGHIPDDLTVIFGSTDNPAWEF